MRHDTAPFEMVLDRPTDEEPEDIPVCPFCTSGKLRNHGCTSTLIGGGDGTWNGDPNHRITDYTCRMCDMKFNRHTKSGKVWYTTVDSKLLDGYPNCYENFIYKCSKCGGDVVRTYTKLDGVTKATSLGTRVTPDGPVHDYRVFFRCGKCGETMENMENNNG